MMKNMVIYLLAVNFITFLLYGDDKSRARRHAWRIPEKVLMGAAVIGGSIGALLGMSIFHHKTRKPKFYIGIPLKSHQATSSPSRMQKSSLKLQPPSIIAGNDASTSTFLSIFIFV